MITTQQLPGKDLTYGIGKPGVQASFPKNALRSEDLGQTKSCFRGGLGTSSQQQHADMGGIPPETAPRARLAARLPLLLRLAHLEQLLGGEGTHRGGGAVDKDDDDCNNTGRC